MQQTPDDLLIIGGGVNGCAIARDAAGRGLRVALVEQGDLAQATSSASTKLFHGGLRYLEHLEFRLVREALAERSILLRTMPHISRPMRFVMPLDPDLRLTVETPATRLAGRLLPPLKRRRPAWAVALALMLYDRLGGAGGLPRARRLKLAQTPAGAPLHPRLATGFAYWDGWVDDSRLVVLCARDAAQRGARILPRTRAVAAQRAGGAWTVTLRDGASGALHQRRARVLVNAAGPWAGALRQEVGAAGGALRLVRGSHIVTRRLFPHDDAYIFPTPDARVVFALPFEQDFTLIGTTEAEHGDPDDAPRCTPGEEAYLLGILSHHLRRPVTASEIVWRFSGVRPLVDDGAGGPAGGVSRDYRLDLDAGPPPLLSVLGGKITTHRRLAEAALDRLAPHLPPMAPAWTAQSPLPGGDLAPGTLAERAAALRARRPFLDAQTALRLMRAYGTDADVLLDGARCAADLGRHFGAGLTAREVDWMRAHEFARTAEDVLWRRSKLGLRLDAAQQEALAGWMQAPGA